MWSWRRYRTSSLVRITIGLFVAIVLYTEGVEPNRVILEEETVSVCGLHPDLDGLRIIQFTDFHSTSIGPREKAAFGLAENLHPDLVVFTGDLCTYPNLARSLAAKMVDLQAPLGSFFIMGNAEYDGDADAIVRAVSEAGMIVLRNEVRLLKKDRGQLWVIGVDDPSTGRSFLEGALLRLGDDRTTPRLLLAHFPTVFSQATHWGIDVVLSGHTHGGQIRLPGLKGAWSSGSKELDKYMRGNFQSGCTWMHVSRGLGTSIIPVRIGSPPEVTLIILEQGGPSPKRLLP